MIIESQNSSPRDHEKKEESRCLSFALEKCARLRIIVRSSYFHALGQVEKTKQNPWQNKSPNLKLKLFNNYHFLCVFRNCLAFGMSKYPLHVHEIGENMLYRLYLNLNLLP